MRNRAASDRSDFFTRAGRLAATLTFAILVAGGCGSVNSAGGDAAAGASGQGGSGGGGAAGNTAGSTGTAGSGSAGTGGSSTGAGGRGGTSGDAGTTGSGGGGTTGSAGTGGSTGSAGRGGATGSAGTGGSTGSGGRGGGTAGSTGSGGGGAGGTTSPCQAVLALDRSCTTAADCFAGRHITDCCGNSQAIGFRNSVSAQFQTLETACAMTYPACGCPASSPIADDGSRLPFDGQPGVTCLQGKCTTFVPDCGRPCGAGTTCFSCANAASTFAACTTMCTASTACTDPALPLCQMGSSGNTVGKFCTAANVQCDTR